MSGATFTNNLQLKKLYAKTVGICKTPNYISKTTFFYLLPDAKQVAHDIALLFPVELRHVLVSAHLTF
jgi:hypothetical protein